MNPLLKRHLYSSVRRSRFFWLLSLYLTGVSVITLLFTLLLMSGVLIEPNATISILDLFTSGRGLYWLSAGLLLLSAGLLAPISALSMLSSEREHRTWDLLRTTTLKSQTIILGKFGAALLNGSIYLLTPLPLLLLGYWIGGITVTELLLTLLFLALNLTLSTMWALFISSWVRRTIAAVLIFYGISLALLPITAIVVSLLVGLGSNIAYVTGITASSSLWIQGLLQYGWLFIVALHPISAAIASEALWIEQNSWLLLSFDVTHYNSMTGNYTTLGIVSFPSPWIPNAILTLLTIALLLWLTKRRLAKPDR